MHILFFPDIRLRTIASPVTIFSKNTHKIIEQMFEIMYLNKGIGLAATQVNVHQRIIVIDVSSNHQQPITLINPIILKKSNEIVSSEEGCLSIPEYRAFVERIKSIKIAAQDSNGKKFEFSTDGLLSICIQHEIDHLNGKLFIDYLSPLKRQRVKKKLEKRARYNIKK